MLHVPCCCSMLCLQGYYRRGDANFMLGKFKEALKDFKTVSSRRFFGYGILVQYWQLAASTYSSG